MNSIEISPGSCLKGTVKIPSSKSIGHRAIICASLADGISHITNISPSRDIKATCEVLQNLGLIIVSEGSSISVTGRGSIEPNGKELFCDESGSTLRFLIPVALLQCNTTKFNGVGKLVERPLTPYYEIFKQQGIGYKNKEGFLPLELEGILKPGNFRIKGNVSSQFISGLMFALPLLNGESIIEIDGVLESRPYIDLTIDTLNTFGIEITNENYEIFRIQGNQKYRAKDYFVEGDYSQAAFFIAAGLLNGDVTCDNLNPSSLQGDKNFIDIARSMGGEIFITDNKIEARKSILRSVEIDASQIPDLVPILAVLASVSKGKTIIYNASRLRIKECDRLHAVAMELNKIGADIIEKEDSLIITGVGTLEGGVVDSWNDHRIAMALTIASLKCVNPILITNYMAVNKSYPNFFLDYKSIGGEANERSMG